MERQGSHDQNLWSAIKRYARKLGHEGLTRAIAMYHSLRDSDTPAAAKGIIASSLGYLAMPLDIAPDPIPFVGLTDDLSLIAAAWATVAMHIKDEHLERARAKVNSWFDSTSG
jgi:uncharacterized membrane protein YkvA (DUF1232 family)